jgi:hypothetical protein
MSLIQDALKRQAEETSATHPPKTPPVVAARQPSLKAKPTPSLLLVIIMLLVVILLITFSGLALYLLRSPASSADSVASPTNVELPLTLVQTPAAVPLTSAPSPAITAPEPTEDPASEPDIIPAWPELNLTGIASSGNQRIAIINGKMLSAGRTVGDVTICDVSETEVVVEFCGERRTLHVDE